ncbi:MAG: type IV secretory system conjugative DNA transfer family protein [Burkholderiales bacterium]|nr:type IV secretory system conjugative DNA transfer family protein [Burkholderiales bacterium]
MSEEKGKSGGFFSKLFKSLDTAFNAPPSPEKPAEAAKAAPAPTKPEPTYTLRPMPDTEALESIPKPLRSYWLILQRIPIMEDTRQYYLGCLRRNEVQEVKQWLELKYLPQLPKALRDELEQANGGARWASFKEIDAAGLFQERGNRYEGPVTLGETDAPDGRLFDIVFSGDGHLLTVAPTGAGKTQIHVLPAVFQYPGPIVALDPKGEIYRELAWLRREKGNVFPWAPFENDIKSACFNPLDFVLEWEDALDMADMMVPLGGERDAFWNTSTRRLLAGVVWYVARYEEDGLRNLQRVYDLVVNPKAPATPAQYTEEGKVVRRGDLLRELMIMTGDPVLKNPADSLASLMTTDNMLTSFVTIAENQLSHWASPRIAEVTQTTTPGFHPRVIWEEARMQDVAIANGVGQHVGRNGRGLKHSVFLIVPPHRIATFAPVLRVIIGVMLKEMIAVAHSVQGHDKELARYPADPVMFLLDELPQLGHLDQIETAITIVRSARVRLWLFAQDLDQMEKTYPKWGSMVSNCRGKMFYGINDLKTAEHISNFVGNTKELFSDKDRHLIAPHELLGPDMAGQQIILVSGLRAIRARGIQFRHEPGMQDYMREHRDDDALPDWDVPEERSEEEH